MPWNENKCQWGHPAPFTNQNATDAVNGANFAQAIYVNISAEEQVTKKAFTYYDFGGYRICVVADVHRKDVNSPWNIAGNCYIPGWKGDNGTGWDMNTPQAVVNVVGPLGERGNFPGNNRYPHPLNVAANQTV